MSAFRQLLLNFVTERAFDDLFARAGRQFLVARWSSESLVRGDADSYRHFASQADLPQRVIAADKRPPSLSPYNTNRVRLQLMLREPLLARLESIILRLLHVFDEDASRMRATVMKAISELVQADPAVMVIPVSVSLCRLNLSVALLPAPPFVGIFSKSHVSLLAACTTHRVSCAPRRLICWAVTYKQSRVFWTHTLICSWA